MSVIGSIVGYFHFLQSVQKVQLVIGLIDAQYLFRINSLKVAQMDATERGGIPLKISFVFICNLALTRRQMYILYSTYFACTNSCTVLYIKTFIEK